MPKKSTEQLLKELKVELRAILMSAGNMGLTLGEICRDYEDITFGCEIIPSDYGIFTDRHGSSNADIKEKIFNLFMKDCKDVLRFSRMDKKFYAVADKSTARLSGMIVRTKVRTRKRNKGKATRMTQGSSGPSKKQLLQNQTILRDMKKTSVTRSTVKRYNPYANVSLQNTSISSIRTLNTRIAKVESGPKKLKPIMIRKFISEIRNYQINKQRFDLDKINEITATLTKGKTTELDCKKYGFNSMQELFESSPFKNSIYQRFSDNPKYADKSLWYFHHNYENEKIFVNFLQKNFGNDRSLMTISAPDNPKKSAILTVDISAIKQKSKSLGFAKTLKTKLSEMHFDTLKEYFAWLAFF